jgi:flavodoxin
MRDTALRALVIAATICVLLDRSSAQQLPANTQPLFAKENVLIVYLSRTNNTRVVAEFIHQKVGGTIVGLELQKPYPADYNATVQQVARENETGFLPPLKTRIDRIEQYDLVFLGFPTWGMRLPPPVKSFLRQYNLKGKTLAPFNTNAGYGEGSSFKTVRELCPESTVLEGLVIRGGVERDGQYLVIKGARAEEAQKAVESWVTKISTTFAYGLGEARPYVVDRKKNVPGDPDRTGPRAAGASSGRARRRRSAGVLRGSAEASLQYGDGVVDVAMSTSLAGAIARENGRFERHELSRQYFHLSSMVGSA